jgi:hypothetical protein
MSDTFSKVEVITGVARRRRFSADQKLAVVAGIAVTNREGLVLAAKAFAGNPYGGHTLAETLHQATRRGWRSSLLPGASQNHSS